MEEVLSFLWRFNKEVTIVLEPQQVFIDNEELPTYWKEAFNSTTKEDKLKVILNEWSKYNGQLREVNRFLYKNLLDVLLIEDREEYSLLYIMSNSKGETSYYQGRLPIKNMMNNSGIVELWAALPDDVKVIYEELHDGWVYYPSQSNGLSPIVNLTILGEDEWGVLEELENADVLQTKLNQSIGVFHNGAGSYLAIDAYEVDKTFGFFWFKDRAPKLDVHFWGMFNAWFFVSIDEDYNVYADNES